jgi:hypothetical protein
MKTSQYLKAATQKTQANYLSDEEARKGADYTWKGKLELLSIDKIIPGEWEDAYIDEHTKPGTKHYEPGRAIGKWRFTIQLYNPFWDEVVKEASTSVWEGDGDLDEPYVNLYSHNFSNLKEIILEYEKAPKKAEFESEVIKVNPDRTKRIKLKLTDEKGEKPQKWQRIDVKVDFGSLSNGPPCCETGEDARFYSFMCVEGEITLEYKAPDAEKHTFDHITVYNGWIIRNPKTIPMTNVDIQDEIGAVDIALINEGYSGSITVTKSWNYTSREKDYSLKYIGNQTITYTGLFKPIPEMEGMEGQPIKIFGPERVTGTWEHHEEEYCQGDCDCPGLVYDEYGSGNVPNETLKGLIIITNIFPTNEKEVAKSLAQFGLANWYDIGTPTETVPTQARSRSKTAEGGCEWDVSKSEAVLTGADLRFKIKDINTLSGRVSWGSSSGSTGISITDMTEAIYDQPPYDPVQDGTDYTYTITWNLRSL